MISLAVIVHINRDWRRRRRRRTVSPVKRPPWLRVRHVTVVMVVRLLWGVLRLLGGEII